jgi:dsDNA-binding SOS-regulon protein
LNLLTREGAFAVIFVPSLEHPQYDEMFELAQTLEHENQLAASVKDMARRWGRAVVIDPC